MSTEESCSLIVLLQEKAQGRHADLGGAVAESSKAQGRLQALRKAQGAYAPDAPVAQWDH